MAVEVVYRSSRDPERLFMVYRTVRVPGWKPSVNEPRPNQHSNQ